MLNMLNMLNNSTDSFMGKERLCEPRLQATGKRAVGDRGEEQRATSKKRPEAAEGD